MRRCIVIIAVIVGLAGCGSQAAHPSPAGSAGPDVVKDLKGLFDDKNVAYESVDFCSHQSGNQYLCAVTSMSGHQESVTVTDDGNSIFEQGYDPNP